MAENQANIVVSWISWQFYQVPRFLLKVWENYFIFATNFFSIPLLLKTFLSPWHRYQWRYPKGFDIQEFFNTFISNLFSRIIGVLIRIILILVGLGFDLVVIVLGGVALITWFLLPFGTMALIIFLFVF